MWNQSSNRQAHLSWLPAFAGQQYPPNAVEAASGLYVIRGRHGGDVIPGKWSRRYNNGFVPYGGEEKELNSFEVLCNTSLKPTEQLYNWVSSFGGHVPDKALKAGETSSSEPLYIARHVVNNEMCIGKVHPSHGCAYFPWGGKEHSHTSYEVLCFLD